MTQDDPLAPIRHEAAPLRRRALLGQLVAGGAHAVLAGGAARAVEQFLAGGDPLLPLAIAGLGAFCKLFATADAVRRERAYTVAAETALRVRLFRGGLVALRRGTTTAEGLATVLVEETRLLVAEALVPHLLLPRRLAALVPLFAVGLVLVPRAAPLALVPILALAALVALFRKTVRRRAEQAAAARNARLAATLDRARHAQLFDAFDRRSEAEAAFLRDGATLAAAEGGVDAIAAALSGANELVAIVGVALFGLLAGAGAVRGLLPALVPFFLAYRPLKELADTRLDLARGQLRLDRLRPFFLHDSATSAPQSRARLGQETLHLEGLKPTHARFAPIDGAIPFGEIVVLRGATGLGKSTLLAQLLGFAKGAGRSYYGSLDLDDAAASRAVFAWVPQEAPVFAGTTEENLFGAPWPMTIPRPEALAPSVAIGAGGRALSGGERQWVALARAVASSSPVLLLDEPTAALDPSAEQAFLATLRSLRGCRTIVLVTHRSVTASIGDRVWDLVPEPAESSLDAPKPE